MRSRIPLLLSTIGSLLTQPALAELDLMPRFTSVVADGIVVRRPYFADGAKRFTVKVDSETEIAELEGSAIFRFKNVTHASTRLRPSPLKPADAFDAENLKRYQAAARGMLPAFAEEVRMEGETADVYPIRDWTSYQFAFTYRLGQDLMRESITFLNIAPAQQIVVQVGAKEANFADIASRSFNIVRRWHQLDPSEQQGIN